MTKNVLLFVLLLIPTQLHLMNKKNNPEDFEDVDLGKPVKSKVLKKSPRCLDLGKLYNKLIVKRLKQNKTDDEIIDEVKRLSDYFEDEKNHE